MATNESATKEPGPVAGHGSGWRDSDQQRATTRPKLDPKIATSLAEATTLFIDPNQAEQHLFYRLRLLIVACCFIIYSYILGGIIFERTQVLLWLLIALIVANLGKSKGAIMSVARDWTPIFLVVIAYDFSRGAADTLGFPIQWDLPAAFDRAIFGEIPTVTLQRWLNISDQPQWWEAISTLVYVTHFVVPYVVMAGLWYHNRDAWSRYFRAFVILSSAGIVTYVLLPTAPPWLASEEGLIGEVTRSTNNGWMYMGLTVAGKVMHTGRSMVNDVAALPSLHAAFSSLPLFAFWSRSNRCLQTLLATYPLAMAFSIVSSGEHYVFDILVGFAYAGLSIAAANRLVDRRNFEK